MSMTTPRDAASDARSWDRESIDALRCALDRQLPMAHELRHEIHQHPNVSGEEHETALRVLAALDIDAGDDIAGGRVFRIGASGAPGVALRAELDALPIREATGLPWASDNGAMHACGHDIHMAALVAVTRAFCEVGTILPLIGILQPREEAMPSGAPDILQSPALRGAVVSAVIGAHVQPRIPYGTFSALPGAVNSSADDFTVVLRAFGGHAGYPHTTGDPIVASASIITALQSVVSRSVDPTHPAVITIGSIASGSAPNVIPSEANIQGTVRAFDEADRAMLVAKVREVALAIAPLHGCHAEIQIFPGEPVLVNDELLAVSAARWIAAETPLVVSPPLRSCGADDFAYYGAAYPSLMTFVGVGEPDGPGLHHEAFAPPDEAVDLTAGALLAGYLAACELALGPLGV